MKLGYFCTYLYQKNFSAYLLFSGIFPQATPLTSLKLNTLQSWKGCVRVNSNLWDNSLNWPYLYDADAFFQFRVLIQILEVISIPNQTRDTFTLIKLKTFHIWKVCVIFNSNFWYNSLNGVQIA